MSRITSQVALRIALLVAIATSAGKASAQSSADSIRRPPTLPAGARVRVWSTLDIVSGFIATRGTVVSMGADTLVVHEDYNDTIPRRIPLGAITRLDVSRGVIPRTAGIQRGARLGLITGLVISPLLMLRDYHSADDGGAVARTVVRDALIVGAEGAVVGAFLGTALRHTIWERVYTGQSIGMIVSPQKAGMSLAF